MNELIRKADDIDADALIGLDYETDSIVPIEGTGLNSSALLPQGSLFLFCFEGHKDIANRRSHPLANIYMLYL